MFIRNKVLYDEDGKACVEGDKVKIFCDDGRILIDVITMITNEQEKGFEDNEIYLKNGYVSAYDIHKVYKVITDVREKIEEYISELDAEIDRLDKILEDMITEPEKETVDQRQKNKIKFENIKSRVNTLMDVKCDLESRLEELV